MLMAIFLFWLVAAEGDLPLTLGPEPPASLAGFVRDVSPPRRLDADRGRHRCRLPLRRAGLAISVVSFPLLLDRDVGLDTAVATSVRAVRANPGAMALWGLIVAAGLVIGSLPLSLGLVVVMPVLGHATWHLYRRVVPR